MARYWIVLASDPRQYPSLVSLTFIDWAVSLQWHQQFFFFFVLQHQQPPIPPWIWTKASFYSRIANIATSQKQSEVSSSRQGQLFTKRGEKRGKINVFLLFCSYSFLILFPFQIKSTLWHTVFSTLLYIILHSPKHLLMVVNWQHNTIAGIYTFSCSHSLLLPLPSSSP